MAAFARRISYSRMMGFALFETAIGWCGIAWSARGVAAVQLPERSEAATRDRLLRRVPGACDGAPPAQVQRAIDDIVALLGGERRDLNHVTIDIGTAPDFHRRVYDAARRIPAGVTLSTALPAFWMCAVIAAAASSPRLIRNLPVVFF